MLKVDTLTRKNYSIIIRRSACSNNADLHTGQVLLENRWNLDLAVTMLTRIKNDNMCCNDCGVDFSESILTLVALLVGRRPVWCKDLVKGGGMGRYSMLTLEILEAVFEKIIMSAESNRRGLAGLVVRVVMAFPEWEEKGQVMKRRVETIRKELGKGDGEGENEKGFYGIYRPIDGVPFCLVPC